MCIATCHLYHGHLPGIPSAREMEASGLDFGEMRTLMVEKIEELTLHMIDIHSRVKQLENENLELKQQLDQIEK